MEEHERWMRIGDGGYNTPVGGSCMHGRVNVCVCWVDEDGLCGEFQKAIGIL